MIEQNNWIKTINGVTIFWLILFTVGFLSFDTDLLGLDYPIIQFPSEWEVPWEVISWVVWGFFVVDVYFKYKNSKNWKVFIRKHWFDIILLIPFFRIFRLIRLLKLIKISLHGYNIYKNSKKKI